MPVAKIVSNASKIRKLLKANQRPKAEKEFGKRPVAQEMRRMAEKAKKEKEAAKKMRAEGKATGKKAETRAKSGKGAEGTRKAAKKSKQQKAREAFERSEKKRKAQKVVPSKTTVGIKRPTKKLQEQMDKEMAEELKGRTVRSRRERIKKATDPKKLRKARRLSEGRESAEAFEARMAREARSGGVEDVGRRRAQRGSAPDPLFQYERSQAAGLMRGDGEVPMTVDEMMKMMGGRKKGGTLGRGMGKALRGGGTVMGYKKGKM